MPDKLVSSTTRSIYNYTAAAPATQYSPPASGAYLLTDNATCSTFKHPIAPYSGNGPAGCGDVCRQYWDFNDLSPDADTSVTFSYS